MEKIYEAIDSITKRLSNPFLVSFAISWLVANWKAVLVAMSDDHYTVKIAYLDQTLYATATNPNLRLIWIPLIASGTYVVVLPLLATFGTVVNGLYDNLNEVAKAFVLKTRVLTLKQSRELQANIEVMLNKVTEDRDRLATARIDSSNKAGISASSLLLASQPLLLIALPIEAELWTGPIEKMPEDRTVGSLIQDDFAKHHGVPKAWLKVFEPNEKMNSFSLQRAAKLYELSEQETLERLLRLSAIGLVNFQWVDDQFRFELSGRKWGDLLQGRRA